ncbi:TPA: hypothetical protein L3925_001928 [Pseudomonas aeruginosa]|nr:hypothetical protein [Pseudomonas aeruginosa]
MKSLCVTPCISTAELVAIAGKTGALHGMRHALAGTNLMDPNTTLTTALKKS